jgi:hypothetical protein
MSMNPKSASALIWAALIVDSLGLMVHALEAQFVFSIFSAVLVFFPFVFAREKTRIAAGLVLALSLALAYAGYPRFIDSPYMQRARAVSESGIQNPR